MLKLDQNTLVLIAGGVSVLIAFLLAYLKTVSKHIKGPLYWSTGNILISFGLFTFAFYNSLGNYLTFVIGGTCITLGISLYYTGLRRFNNKSINYWVLIGVPLVDLILGTIFTAILPSDPIRMILYSSLNIFISIIMITEFLKISSRSFRRIVYLGIFVFIVYGCTMVIRLITTSIHWPDNAADETFTNKTLFYFTILSQIIIGFVFMLLFNIKLSDELKNQVKNRDKFFSIISHDLIGPIGTIAEMLKTFNQTDFIGPEMQKRMLNELESLSDSTWLLLQNLLEWSRIQINTIRVSKKSFNISELINQNIQLFEPAANSKSISLKHKETIEINCFADERMIDTILRNLISNAIKFTPQNGTIEILCTKENQSAVIQIKDSGIGINKKIIEKLEKKEQLISSYGTDGEKGAGLGLLLCHDFIRKNDGKMKVKSVKEGGTNITIELPSDFNI